MAEDLDDLLDEVERTLFYEKSPVDQLNPSKPDPGRGVSDSGGFLLKKTSDLDDIITDICASCEGEDQLAVPPVARPPPRAGPSRCFPVLVGGSTTALGCSEPGAQRSCDRLHCTTCDFAVSHFNGYVWHARSDYLFFRNNVPDFQRLSKNLIKKKGFRAYACQCSWCSISQSTELTVLPKLKWVCSKH